MEGAVKRVKAMLVFPKGDRGQNPHSQLMISSTKKFCLECKQLYLIISREQKISMCQKFTYFIKEGTSNLERQVQITLGRTQVLLTEGKQASNQNANLNTKLV